MSRVTISRALHISSREGNRALAGDLRGKRIAGMSSGIFWAQGPFPPEPPVHPPGQPEPEFPPPAPPQPEIPPPGQSPRPTPAPVRDPGF